MDEAATAENGKAVSTKVFKNGYRGVIAPFFMTIKVIATNEGFYGGARRKKGDHFLISKESDFSSKWMTFAPKQTRSAIQEIITAAKRRRAQNGTR